MTEARQALLTRIDSEVRAYRAALEAETRETCGELSAADALLLDAICDTERIRREAVAQIAEKGLRERYSNGRQSLERENKAVGQAHKAAQTLGKLMAALKARQRKGQAGAQLPEGDVYKRQNLCRALSHARPSSGYRGHISAHFFA